jgi:uncharacterized protein (TIGR02996 family)
MPEQSAFVAAICEDPDDDTHRLVYADWLDERGRPGDAAHAELMRVQCALARLSPGAPSAGPLRAREKGLIAECGPRLRAAVEAIPGVKVDWGARGELGAATSVSSGELIPGVRTAGRLERGFVASVGIDLDRWGDAIPARMAALFAGARSAPSASVRAGSTSACGPCSGARN